MSLAPLPTHRHLGAASLSSADVDILRAALLDGEAAISAYRSWRRELDWDSISTAWQRIVPLLQHNMSRLGVKDPLMDRFRGVRRYFWATNLRRIELAKEIFAGLNAARIPALALKGTSLIASGYADRSLRPMEDVDILVHRNSLPSAIEVLATRGFYPHRTVARCLLDRIVPEGGLPGWPFVNDRGLFIDLHWNMTQLDRRPDADKSMWLASRSVIFEGMAFQVCDPADQLLHIFAHAVSDLDPRFMRWIADATFVIRGAPDLAWQRFAEQARDHRLSIFCVDALVLLRRLVNLPIPTDTMSRLKRQSSMSERVERFSLRWNASPGVGRMTQVFLDLAAFRRGQSDLFRCNAFAALGPWFAEKAGTKTARDAVLRALYYRLGLPRALRTALADESRLAYPALSQLPALGQSLDPSAGTYESAFVHGWSIAEPEGRWTVGNFAIIAWRIDGARRGPLVLHVAGYSVANARQRKVGVVLFANGVKLASWQFKFRGPAPLPARCIIPEHAITGRSVLALTFEITEPLTPRKHSASSDARRLGLLLQKIEFEDLQ